MDETSALNTTQANTSRLPDWAVIFTPVFLVQLLLGLVSNLLLIALLVKASSVNGQNNINIYLYSMATNNLLCLFLSITLLISTVTKEWVLGQTMCSLNQFITYMVNLPQILLQMYISRERYKAVLHFFEWKPYSRRTYIQVAVVWITATCAGMLGLLQGGQIVGKEDGVISCYAPSRWFEERRLRPLAIAYVIGVCISCVLVVILGAVHYAYTFRELYIIKDIRARGQQVKLNHRDIPISWEAEVRSLKSMTCLFVFNIVPFMAAAVYFLVIAIIAINESRAYQEVDVPLLHVAILCIYLMPTASPLLLIAINKRFRMRMKDLFRWQLKPTNDSGPDAIRRATVAISQVSALPLHLHVNNGKAKETVIANTAVRPPFTKILYNTWTTESKEAEP